MAIKKSDLYSSIWASCDELRGGMDASQYKDYVLFMLFIKYVSDKYAHYEGFEPPIVIPAGASFQDMVALKGDPDIGNKINTQVMLFADRLGVWNHGTLPPTLTLEKLRQPHGSVPANPLLAEPLYLTRYIERMGTGTGDMIRRCREAGLPEPEFAIRDGFVTTLHRPVPEGAPQVTGEVTGEVAGEVTAEVAPELRLALVLTGEMTRRELQQALGLQHDEHFRLAYLAPALDAGLVEMTIPDKPTSRLQKYRLTAKGRGTRDASKGGRP